MMCPATGSPPHFPNLPVTARMAQESHTATTDAKCSSGLTIATHKRSVSASGNGAAAERHAMLNALHFQS
jgi:hypothetical protein